METQALPQNPRSVPASDDVLKKLRSIKAILRLTMNLISGLKSSMMAPIESESTPETTIGMAEEIKGMLDSLQASSSSIQDISKKSQILQILSAFKGIEFAVPFHSVTRINLPSQVFRWFRNEMMMSDAKSMTLEVEPKKMSERQPSKLREAFTYRVRRMNFTNIFNRMQVCSEAKMDLPKMKLGSEKAGILVARLSLNPTLATLNLYDNEIGAEGGKAIGNALRTNTTLTTLSLEWNGIGAEGGKAISDALRTNTTLTTLNLGSNRIGTEGGKAIGDALRTNTTLTTLDLFNNGIGAEGGKAIGDALRTNTTLTTLNLFRNSIGDEDGKAIGDALRTNTTLTALNLKGMTFPNRPGRFCEI